MAWNPSPKVAKARDFGEEYNYDKVIIIAANENKGIFEVISYGETKEKCKQTSKAADTLHRMITNADLQL